MTHDDRLVSWRELGELLESNEGFWLQMEILDASEA